MRLLWHTGMYVLAIQTYTRVTTIKVLRTIGITNFYKDFLIPNSGYNQSVLFILLQFVRFA